MTIDEIRLQNLMILLRENAGNNQAQLARSVNSTPSYINQIIKGTKTRKGTPRGVGDDLAERLEKAFKKPRGWMDTPHPDGLGVRDTAAEYSVPETFTEQEKELVELCRKYGLTDDFWRIARKHINEKSEDQ